jgi:hypothetical protein
MQQNIWQFVQLNLDPEKITSDYKKMFASVERKIPMNELPKILITAPSFEERENVRGWFP